MKRLVSILISLNLLLVVGSFALAQTTQTTTSNPNSSFGLDKANEQAGLPSSLDVPSMAGKFLGTILGFTGTIFFILVVYAGLMWMTAAGSEDRIAKAKKILTAAIIGLIIVLSAYAITKYIGSALG